ncbi:arsenate reductase/protein-tyrosine-phosphatase family protein [Asticcacaulis sp. AC466]|uniref:arsenate reductase/protein-tyrosine-phosphatase family protein n=1 Tax=Asticcacaulis sp. AC466 TaxID=1282362 RepID=UPI000415F3ED|nr:protein-tyrosine-phosphatase [Asticcacaulis sp. AC466]
MTTAFRIYNVLFLGVHNTARSILAEALLNRLGAGRFEARSAGFDPSPVISPYALALLEKINYKADRLATKSMMAVMGANDPGYDFIIRLSPDRRANTLGRAPQFFGKPVFVDWHLPDPCDVMGSSGAIAAAYSDLFNHLAARVDAFANLPASVLEGCDIQARLEHMGGESLRFAA